MSNEKILNRLDCLLTELEQDNENTQTQPTQNGLGWGWECNAGRQITFCSPEVKSILGIAPEDFLGKEIDSYRLTPELNR